MPPQKTVKPKAIALLSGGLDSVLAAKIVKDQGVDVIGLHLVSPFGCREEVEKVAAGIGIPLILREKGEAYIDLLENPKHGYGAQMNPCIDCRIFMFQFADRIRVEENAQFIVTGEVLGQRPFSQVRKAIDLIDRKSELEHRVLRPLSAHHFEPTLAEEMGWIDREALFRITGRGRGAQLELAQQLGIPHYSSPAGGCLLTEARFTPRLKDFFDHRDYDSSEKRLSQGELLRYGRHFRFHEQLKIVVGRNYEENLQLEKLFPKTGGTLYIPHNFQGPIALAVGGEDDQLTGKVIARYGKFPADVTPTISKKAGDEESFFEVNGRIEDNELESFLI